MSTADTAEFSPDAKSIGAIILISSASIAPAGIEPDPLEIEPAPAIESAPIEMKPLCELYGYTIEDLEELIYLRAADLIAQWERADPRDRWRHTGEAPPPSARPAARPVAPYRTPQATVDAFLYVAGLDEPEHLARWLDQHPRDEKYLCKLWKAKNAAEA
jgi:hypothetical protein